MNLLGNFAPIVFGHTQAGFLEILMEALSSPTDETPLEMKTVETEMLRALFSCVEAELKNNKTELDSKWIIPVNSKGLGPWTTIATKKSLQLPFKIGDRNLSVEIPLFGNDFAREKTTAHIGFPPSAKILVVDDSSTTRKLVVRTLMSAGYFNIDECEDGLSAYNKISMVQPRYNLVVADWHMPKMTGFELLKKVREGKDKYDQTLPIILVTGEKNQSEVIAAIKERVSGYVVKPFDPQTLYDALKKAAPRTEG
jgi:two-component system chemotaxis response regulator CheY